MSDTINLPGLISRLASEGNCDPATARRFLHEFFALIETTLLAGESVRIKGIGEFVASEDPANPVLFKPDDQLAAAANEPFAIFEAVELNDGVTEETLETGNDAADQEDMSAITDDAITVTDEPEPQPEPEPQ
ncbi:MAG: HU family DNA-binding protein, partial [Bacteroidales bacterium]|nr:HU family DNA-binding protein [Bacteroidales bacterium]